MAIDQRIEELIQLYTTAINAKRPTTQDSEAAAIAVGLENAVLAAAAAEAEMIKSVAMERMTLARMKAAGVKR